MYVAVALILVGWAVSFRSAALVFYCVAVVTVFHFRVVFWEEPWAARTFGAAWEDYQSRIPRWFR